MTLTWWKQNKYRSCDGIICDGSVRSGKTVCMALSFVLWSMERFENQRFALCGKTIESLRRNVTGLLPQWLEGICQIEERRSENRLTISMNGRRNDYYLFGGKDEGSYALIQGMTLSGVLFDEVALMPRSFVEQALARCSVEGSKFFFNCNPEGLHKLCGQFSEIENSICRSPYTLTSLITTRQNARLPARSKLS